MSAGFTISYQPADGTGTVRVLLSGELDVDQADRVRDGLTGAALSPGCRHVVVDLGGLTFVDSSGLGTLVVGYKVATAAGATFAVTKPTPYIRSIIRVLGLSEIFGLAARG